MGKAIPTMRFMRRLCYHLSNLYLLFADRSSGFEKVRQLDSCQFPGFERIAAGEDPLRKKPARFRNRYLCKYVWKHERFNAQACTGCGRCIECCLGNINKNRFSQKCRNPPDRMMRTDTMNIYQPLKASVEQVIIESPLIRSFVLIPEQDFSFRTGEFIELTINGFGEAPFTPSSSPLDRKKLEVTVMKTGYVTEKIHALKAGDLVGIRGPFGRGYPVEKFYGKELIILGGGCGFAPIRSLLFSLIAEKENFKESSFAMAPKPLRTAFIKLLWMNSEKWKDSRFIELWIKQTDPGRKRKAWSPFCWTISG